MVRILLFASLIFAASSPALAQLYSMAVGINTGFTVPVTLDKGLSKDPRYSPDFGIKAAPVGLSYSMDYKGFGFIINPAYVTIGQNFSLLNTAGGDEGKRKIDLSYVQVPVALKIHIIDLSFFRISGIVSANAAFLLNASDKLNVKESKLRFPAQTYTLLPADYTLQYDGVLVPSYKGTTPINNSSTIGKSDYEKIQFFGGAGLRADWDVNNSWRVSMDMRGYYGLTDSRGSAYVSEVNSYQTLYDNPGKRNEFFAHISLGIARYLEYDKDDKERAKKVRGSSKRYKPQKSSTVKPSKR